MQVFVKTLKESIPVDANYSDSIKHIKKLIQDTTNIPVNEQQLSFGSILLEDENRLSDYSIQHESTIHLKLGIISAFNVSVLDCPIVDTVLKLLELNTCVTVDKASLALQEAKDAQPLDAAYCTMCDEELRVPALFACKNCEGLIMCLKCKEAHLRPKYSRSHSIFDLKDSPYQVEEECTKHPKKVIEFCCQQCHVTACASCGLLDHSGHKMVSLQEGAADERSQLDQAILELQSLFDEKLAEVSKRLTDYKADVSALKAELNGIADRLIALINEKRQLALDEIDAKAAAPLQRLGDEKASVEKFGPGCRSCGLVSRRLLGEGSASEVYALSPFVRQSVAALRLQMSSGHVKHAKGADGGAAVGAGGAGGAGVGSDGTTAAGDAAAATEEDEEEAAVMAAAEEEDKLTISGEAAKAITDLAANLFTVHVDSREQRIAAKLAARAAEDMARSTFPVGLVVRLTPGGAKGACGPSLQQVQAQLGAIALKELIRVDEGIISLPAIPQGTDRITCAGAQGGGTNYIGVGNGGAGYAITAQFTLSSAVTYRCIVGQQPSDDHPKSGSGGGGSFFFHDDTPLLVGGGGGGASTHNIDDGLDALPTPDGCAGRGGAAGGTAGAGGSGVGTGGSPGCGSGGGGWSGDGKSGQSGQTAINTFGTGGSGQGATRGAHGGKGHYSGWGGFGGGGGNGNYGGGGGGGYSGGGSGNQNGQGGGGGGSYSASEVITGVQNRGDGYIEIQRLT